MWDGLARKRLRSWLVVVLVGAGSSLVAVIGAAVGDNERVAHLWTLAHVGAPSGDGGGAVATITEVIDYDFGIESRHGIFREVPGLDRDAPVQVSSPTAPDQLSVEPSGTGVTRLRIGDPDRTVTGRHRYRIAYPLDDLVSGAELRWDVVGDEWDVDLHGVEAHLVTPFELGRVECFVGEPGSLRPCADEAVTRPRAGALGIAVDGVDAGKGLTVVAEIQGGGIDVVVPQEPEGPAIDPGNGIARPALLALVAALTASIPAVALTRRAGREEVASLQPADAAFADEGDPVVARVDASELADLATVEFEPPDDLTAARGGVVANERAGDDQATAWLLERAIEGSVEIDRTDGVVVRRRAPAPDAGDEAALATMFDGRDEVELDGYDKAFAGGMGEVVERPGDWKEQSGLWAEEGERRRFVWTALASGATLVGAAGAGAGAAFANRWGGTWLLAVLGGAVLAGFGGGVLSRQWELRVRTPAGTAAWLRVASFRRFLAESEAAHVEWAAEQGLLREYTAWAVALGEADHWAEVAAQVSPEVADVSAVHFAALGPSLVSASSVASTPPSSSGGGGGGGGGVGSGGGGGGGGSW